MGKPRWLAVASWTGYPYHNCATISMVGIAILWHVRLCEFSILLLGCEVTVPSSPFAFLLLVLWVWLVSPVLGLLWERVRGVFSTKWMALLSLLAAWSWFSTRHSWVVDSCSKLPPYPGVTTSNNMLMSLSCGAYFYFILHVQCCVVGGWWWLLGCYILHMAAVHFFPHKSCWSCLWWPFLGCKVSSSNGGCKCKSRTALFVGVVDTDLGVVARWVDVEVVVKVVVVRGPIDKY